MTPFFCSALLRILLCLAVLIPAIAAAQTTTNLLTNGSFENGPGSGWVLTSTTGTAVINNNPSFSHGGSYYALMAGVDSASDSLYQDVFIPGNATSVAVQFWYSITTAESPASAYDTMVVRLQNPTSGATLATLASLSNLNSTAGAWVLSNAFDVTAFKGQTVRLRFTVATDSSILTTFRVDDATFNAVTPSSFNTTTTLSSSANPSNSGQSVTFTAIVSAGSGTPTGTVTFRDGSNTICSVLLSGGQATCVTSALTVGTHSMTAQYGGSSTYAGSTSAVLNQTVQLSRVANPPRLANIATRMQVLTGDNVMIGGFIIGGTTPKKVVVRARGPSLTALGVPGALANPTLSLFSGQTVIATNDNYGSAANVVDLQGSGFAPAHALESAILITLNPGAYTAIVSGVNGGTGVGIVEVFEVDEVQTPLINIATRGQVLTGDNVMIGGFIIQGNGPQTVVVRARGPSLTALGVPGALADPILQLYSGQTVIASSDDWENQANAATIQSSGFAPANPLESAILITLQPGAYTAIVSGYNLGTGVGIIEVFAVQ